MLSTDQFTFLRDQDPNLHKTHIFAVDDMDRVQGQVTYSPPQEAPTFRQGDRGMGPQTIGNVDHETGTDMAYPKEEPGEQGQLFMHRPGRLDDLAVRSELRGQGLGTALVRKGIEQYQHRFGSGAVPAASTSLTAGSAAIANKVLGEGHRASWGTDDPTNTRAPQNTWANSRLFDAAGRVASYRDRMDEI